MELGFLGIDQYGTHYHIDKYPRKELCKQLNYKKARKMYCDTKNEKAKHIGYVIGFHWIRVFKVCSWR